MTEGASNRPLDRILLVSFALCGSLLLFAAWTYYTGQQAALESSAAAELIAVADVKASQIANWRSERIGDGGVLSSTPVAALVRHVLAGSTPSVSERAALEDILRRFITAFHYAGAALMDQNGKMRLEVNRNHVGQEPYRTFEQTASKSNRVLLSDLYLDSTGRPWMLLTVPVAGAGALILDIDPAAFLYPYVHSWPTNSRTGETILVRRDGTELIYLSHGRNSQGDPQWQQKSTTIGPPGLKMASPVYRWVDYRRAPVMGIVQPVPDSNWSLVAKIDLAEVEAPLQRLGWELALVIALIAITNLIGARLIGRNRQLRFYRDREAWFRQITNDTPAYLWMTSPGVAGCFINQQCARFLGTNQDQIETLWRDCVHPDDRPRALAEYSACLEGQSELQGEFRFRRSDGAYRWMVVHGLPRHDPNGKFAGYAGSLIDITERRAAEEHLQSANQALAAELLERTRSEQQVHALSARLIDAQEEERARLARELHDDLSQQIAAISIAISNFKKRLPSDSGPLVDQCNRIHQKLVHLAECTRRLSHELHPAVLQHSGLGEALRNYCLEYSALTSHRIRFDVEGAVDSVPPAVALCVYRVTQEALQNSIKHAKVDEAEVVLKFRDDTLCLIVSDRGIGMPEEPTGGLGLVSIKERARLVNGTVEVRGHPGEGVTLILTIPIKAASAAQA